ncbi:MAG TPA: hypothetical protein VK066_14230 [Chloroflexota bacterium]|nr:hypothetical protein [Chloroflexota bacterium]
MHVTDPTAIRLDCRFQPGEQLSTPEAVALLDAHYARPAATFQLVHPRAPGNAGVVDQGKTFGYRLFLDACYACGRGGAYQPA